jgi:hypothetical protein
MTALADRTTRTAHVANRDRLFDPGDEPTLDDVVTTAWGGLALRGSSRCLVCGALATRSPASDSTADSGECPSCGSTLE